MVVPSYPLYRKSSKQICSRLASIALSFSSLPSSNAPNLSFFELGAAIANLMASATFSFSAKLQETEMESRGGL
jgi:hypothetical protein